MKSLSAVAESCAVEANERARGVMADLPACWNSARPIVDVYDDVLADPLAYRAAMLDGTFGTVTVGPAMFHGLSAIVDDRLSAIVQARRPECEPTLTFARLSPAGQLEPNFVHTDVDMGQWTGILYLNPDPPDGDGTTFWQHRDTGATQAQARTAAEALAEGQAWRNPAVWTPWRTVAARFNRLVWFEAGAFHSRALADNYGQGPTARLIQVIFGCFRGIHPCV